MADAAGAGADAAGFGADADGFGAAADAAGFAEADVAGLADAAGLAEADAAADAVGAAVIAALADVVGVGAGGGVVGSTFSGGVHTGPPLGPTAVGVTGAGRASAPHATMKTVKHQTKAERALFPATMVCASCSRRRHPDNCLIAPLLS